ncbi:MAG: hypothetical protein AAF682_29755 [Planctomycetota bacterium]
MLHRIALAAALCLLPAAPWALAPPEAGQEREDVERLEAWPELPKDAKKGLKTQIERLRKARTEEMGRSAHAELVAMGAGAAPQLLVKLGKEKDEAAAARIEAVLAAVTGAAHTRLLAAEFGHRSQAVRIWTLERVAGFPDAGTREAAESALQRAGKVAEPEKADRREHLAAALATTAAGSLEGLEHLHARARKAWGKHGARMRAALEGVRGPDATRAVSAKLSGDREAKIAALRLLAGCGDDGAKARIKPFLADNDNSLRIAAINALRGIVDGDPPLERLPVFEAIELAKKWQARV